MELGAILLLDEIDLAHPSRIMCLQSILEGKGYFIKKTGEYITPAPGFNVIATANTKGKGCEDGQFVGTNVLNEAMLERFPLTCEQPYPPISTERKILTKVADSLGITKSEERGTKSGNVIEFIEKLTDWADIIRKTYYDGGVDSLITTRRLIHIINAYAIFNDRMTAIDKCTNRFDEETKVSFLQLYTKIDSEVSVEGESVDI
jgi:MoxR-like ATPase